MTGCSLRHPDAHFTDGGVHGANLTIDPPAPREYPKTMQVNLQYAEEHLADLGDAVDAGQEVEISRPNKPSLKLVVSHEPATIQETGQRILGAGRGELRVPSWEEWKAMDKELADQINNSPLFPSDEQ